MGYVPLAMGYVPLAMGYVPLAMEYMIYCLLTQEHAICYTLTYQHVYWVEVGMSWEQGPVCQRRLLPFSN